MAFVRRYFRLFSPESSKKCYLLLFQLPSFMSLELFQVRTVLDFLPIQVQNVLYRSGFYSGSSPFTCKMVTDFNQPDNSIHTRRRGIVTTFFGFYVALFQDPSLVVHCFLHFRALPRVKSAQSSFHGLI